MLNGIKGKLNDDIMIVTGVTGGEIVSWFYPLLICSDFRYIIISIESLDAVSYTHLDVYKRQRYFLYLREFRPFHTVAFFLCAGTDS